MYIHIELVSEITSCQLSDLAIRSKSYWNYDKDFIERCREELHFDEEYTKRNLTYLAKAGIQVAGFYSLEKITSFDVELGALFVDPPFIKKGFGKILIQHAFQKASEIGYQKMIIQGDPNAEKFYLKMGAQKIGEKESESIPGRKLPLFEVKLHSEN